MAVVMSLRVGDWRIIGAGWLRHSAAVGWVDTVDEIADTQRGVGFRRAALARLLLAVRGCRHLPEDPAAVEKGPARLGRGRP